MEENFAVPRSKSFATQWYSKYYCLFERSCIILKVFAVIGIIRLWVQNASIALTAFYNCSYIIYNYK